MTTFQFPATIGTDGVITVPPESNLFGREVDVVLMPRSGMSPMRPRKKITLEEFLSKFSGCIEGAPMEIPGDDRYNAIMERYQRQEE